MVAKLIEDASESTIYLFAAKESEGIKVNAKITEDVESFILLFLVLYCF
ncbi:hypothetical protein VHA_001110 [Grimontia hollisae CIP 101886]|uniref:Uncharacterized protein n=1 Tax=Grimontia hollisae CIP 101886 TaxID=675812 RepID=D0I5U3_GRIHO|nr:hypothetical protein VHA_001110 [Grimontia hollisae CIP 101886]